ncbi:MAG TPA: N-acetylmuramoyl-L-alanine amidase [bacterium]
MKIMLLLIALGNTAVNDKMIVIRIPSADPVIVAVAMEKDGAPYISLDDLSASMGERLKIHSDKKRHKISVNGKTAYIFEDSRQIITDKEVFSETMPVSCGSSLCVPVDSLNIVLSYILFAEARLLEIENIPPETFHGIINEPRLTTPQKPSILIDPGHGGDDPGTASNTGLREKDIVLDIAKAMGEILGNYGIDVIYTRTDDNTLPLPYRVGIANGSNALLFISIHANFSRNNLAKGFEVFFLSSEPSDEETFSLVERENTGADGEQGINIVQAIAEAVERTSIVTASKSLAETVYVEAEKTLDTKRGLKQAPFYILSGTRKPGILVEIGFLSNDEEAKLLEDYKYREIVADVLCRGILNFVNKISGGIL